ncbi:MAG: L-serine dehydratase [Pseudohongiellaceae bacterium]|jgi:L-serine dehydratase
MAVSVFDMFKIGIGPSSSHTVGPMRAARRFATELASSALLPKVCAVRVELFGSLGATGRGHGADVAVVLGLEGETPEEVDIDSVQVRMAAVRERSLLSLAGEREIPFKVDRCIAMRRKSLPGHPNGMSFVAHDAEGGELLRRIYYSVGGGFVVDESHDGASKIIEDRTEQPYSFSTGDELLAQCVASGLSISTLMLENECVWRTQDEVRSRLKLIWDTMARCVQRGCEKEGLLPGGLRLKRRAAVLYRRMRGTPASQQEAYVLMDWVNLWAMAANEENAAGGRVVTAPTNGAAGVIPAVVHHYLEHCHGDQDGVERFLLTAGAIGTIYLQNASISGAEVGCQGEVGVACSMAAAGLAEVLGGTVLQVEHAAEIGMEHNLGLTCDPVGGLVQVPCIERNAMGAVKAINAARLALQGDGSHMISLDKVIATMRQTGADMKLKYKETSRGGLAVNIIEC